MNSSLPRPSLGLALGVIGILIIAAVILYNYAPPAFTTMLDLPRSPQGQHRQEIGGQVESWATNSNIGRRLVLSDVATFDWDRVLILAPYATDQEARNQLGFAWNVEDWSSMNEGMNLVGFALDKHIVAWTSVSRLTELLPHPTTEGDTLLLSRDAAVLTWTGSAFEVAR